MSPPSAASVLRSDPGTARRLVSAVLRWRFHRELPRAFPPRALEAARLVSVALHASFQTPSLRGDAPGVAGLRFRRGWIGLARRFELPPPWRAQREGPQVEAVLVLPEGPVLSILIVTAAAASRADLRWVEERTAAIEAILAGAGTATVPRVLEPGALAWDPLLAHRLVLFGGLAAGRLSSAVWAALEAHSRRPIDPRDLVELATEAPGAFPALALTLACGSVAPAPLQAARRWLEGGATARTVADLDLLCARWAAEACPAQAPALQEAARLAADPGKAAHAGAVLTLGAELALPLARAIRRSRRAGLGAAERARWRERVGPELPRALLPALGARLGTGTDLETVLDRVGRRHEVRLPGGAVLGRGASPLQARVRALSVLASAALEPLLDHAQPPWRNVVGRLAQPREAPALLLVVEPSAPSGPPYDPLNRGPDRRLGFPGGLAIRLSPGRRPSARALTAVEMVERLLDEVSAGSRVEVLPSRSEANPVAARLSQVAALVQARGALPVAVEAGGHVSLLQGRRRRTFRLDRIAARPRSYLPDPDAPDLAFSPGERRAPGLSGDRIVECRAYLLDASRAAIGYADGAHHHLREVVFLSELEEHLRETRAILQAADPRAILTVHLADELEGAVRRVGPPGPALELSVRAGLPWDLQVEVEGAWYGGDSGRSWRDAARRLLVRWPRDMEARLSVVAVHASARGKRRGGLLALYARSLALRRIRTHLVQTLRTYQKPRARRSEG